jgi:hypothetical protein
MPTAAALPEPLTNAYYGLPLWAWIAAGLAIVIILIMIIALSSSSNKKSRFSAAFNLRLADARWFADSLTLAIADRTKGEAEVVRTWTDGMPRITTLSQQLYELSTAAPNDRLATEPRTVAQAVDNLRQVLDADVRLRTQGYAPGQDALIAESAMIVGQRRQDLDSILRTYGH